MKRGNVMKGSLGEKIFKVINTIALILLSAVFVVPYLIVLSSSVSDELTLLKDGYSLIPRGFTFAAYEFIFKNCPILLRSIFNSVGVTIVGTTLGLVVQLMLGYGMSKAYLPGYKVINFLIMFTMMFSGGLVPSYLINRALGLVDSYWALILPGLCSSWNLLLIRNYFQMQPAALEEAASIDGASQFRIFTQIAVPTAKPIIATIALFAMVAGWNDWYLAMLYIQNRNMYPIQQVIRELLANFNVLVENSAALNATAVLPQESAKMAAVVVGSLPIILVYPFLQKYFISGMMLGSVKE